MFQGLKQLAAEWHDCQRCPLAKERIGPDVVFGAGSPHAKYLLLYETPSETDVEMARPFTGKEGHLLSRLLERAKIQPNEVFCAPIVGCRPTLFQQATIDAEATILDREPTKEELAACQPRVTQLLYRLDPILVFALGALPYKALIKPKDRGNATSLDKAVGELFITRIPGLLKEEITYDVMPLLGIKKILSNPSSAQHGALATTARHMHKGDRYAKFVEETGKRDAKAAGFAPEDASP